MKKFLHERDDFKELISALSLELKIDSQLIEKDYWIMHALWGLKNLGFIFELKGGTSLSKGWKCIDRFSEDLDIFIHPSAKLYLPVGKNHLKPSHVQSRRDYFDSLPAQLIIPGFGSVARDPAFDDEKLMRNAGLRLFYPNLFGKIEGLKDGVLLEAGFDQTTPYEELLISSWLVDRALEVKLDITDNRAKNVNCYVPEYTFVEKLQTISTKYRQLEEKGEKPINFMRHYYDVFQLLKLERVKKFIGTDEYFEHKNKRFRSSDKKDLTQNEAFTISDPKKRKSFQESFENSKGLYYNGQPDFQTIIDSFRGILKDL